MNKNYDATDNLNIIIKAIEYVRKLGLHVYIDDNKLCVANTVACQDRINRGLSCKDDSFAYAEYDKLTDD